MTAERPGLVDLRDLYMRAAWDDWRLAGFLATHGLAVTDPDAKPAQRFDPPRVLVAIAPWADAWMVQRHAAWLRAAEHVLVIRERAQDDLALDPDLESLVEKEWAAIDVPIALFDDAAAALERARVLAATLPARPEEARPSAAPAELPISAWSRFEPGKYEWAFLDRVERHGDEIAIGPAPGPPWGATPAEAQNARRLRPGHLGLGADPIHPVRWCGGRMYVWWYYGSTHQGGFLSGGEHDYPCGPGKKLYGYHDNDAVQVTLAPDASRYAARFDRDVLVTSAVPLPWRRSGDFDVAARENDPHRAVFYAQDPSEDEILPRPDDLADEDARDLCPTLVLVPSGYAIDLSYRVYRIVNGREGRTDAQRVHVGGPNEGIAIFDAAHRLVRRTTGSLIGGWYRFATIAHEGAYWREDLVTGERKRLAPIDPTMSEDPAIEAVARDAILEGNHELAREVRARGPVTTLEIERVYAIPQTKNVLLVSKQHVRVI